MNDFTQDELTLMSIYNGSGTRQGLIDEMTAMRARQQYDDGAAFAMPPHAQHDAVVSPFHDQQT